MKINRNFLPKRGFEPKYTQRPGRDKGMCRYWGYAADENYSNEELVRESYKGIRPAPGYSACPDHTEKDKIWTLLDVKKSIAVSLTETRAMWPGASVCGWYFSHPDSQYFSVLKNQSVE